MPLGPPTGPVGTVPLQRFTRRAAHFLRLEHDVVFERADSNSRLAEPLHDLPVTRNGIGLVVAVPIDHVGVPLTCGATHFFDRIPSTPLQRPAAGSQRRDRKSAV